LLWHHDIKPTVLPRATADFGHVVVFHIERIRRSEATERDKHVSFEFVRQQLKESYSETGRPSIDPELLLRMLLIGYLYGVTSEL
jgi:hypothetical protein